MKPINSFKKWLLIFCTLYWGHSKEKVKEIIMNVMGIGITIELFLLIGVLFWIKKMKSNKNRQPSLSKKIIKNLKFWKNNPKIKKISESI